MTESKDFYQVLGVQFDAEDVVIAGAYRALVKKYHPDVWKGPRSEGEEKLKKINEAFETLNDKTKRSEYDIKNGFYPSSEEEEKKEASFKTEKKKRREQTAERNKDEKANPDIKGKNLTTENILEGIDLFFPRLLTVFCVNIVLYSRTIILPLLYFVFIFNFILLIFPLLISLGSDTAKPFFLSTTIFFTVLFAHATFNDCREIKITTWNKMLNVIGKNKNLIEGFFIALCLTFLANCISSTLLIPSISEALLNIMGYVLVSPALFVPFLGLAAIASNFSERKGKIQKLKTSIIILIAIELDLGSSPNKVLLMDIIYFIVILYVIFVAFWETSKTRNTFVKLILNFSIVPIAIYTVFMHFDMKLNEASYYYNLEVWVNNNILSL